MNKNAMIIPALAVVLGMGASAWAQQQGVTDAEILLGDVVPLTGPPALLGVAHYLGVKAAVAEANDNGGVAGRKIKLISEDDGYVPTRTVQVVRKVLNSDKIFAFTAISGTGQSQAAMPLVKQSGLPAMAPITTWKGLHDPVIANVFAVGYDTDKEVEEIVTNMAKKFPGKKWALVSQDDDYGEDVREGFAKAVDKNNLEVVSEQIYKKGQTDFASEMLKLKRAGAEALFAGGVLAENVTMAKELERIGVDIPIGVTHVSRVAATIKLLGSAGNDVYTADYVYLESTPAGQAFTTKLEKYLSEDEMKKVNRYTSTGYASTVALLDGISRCEDDMTAACVNKELTNVRELETGVMSPITFTEDEHLAAPDLMFLTINTETGEHELVE